MLRDWLRLVEACTFSMTLWSMLLYAKAAIVAGRAEVGSCCCCLQVKRSMLDMKPHAKAMQWSDCCSLLMQVFHALFENIHVDYKYSPANQSARFAVYSVQIDNQLLSSTHPVVLCHSSTGATYLCMLRCLLHSAVGMDGIHLRTPSIFCVSSDQVCRCPALNKAKTCAGAASAMSLSKEATSRTGHAFSTTCKLHTDDVPQRLKHCICNA